MGRNPICTFTQARATYRRLVAESRSGGPRVTVLSFTAALGATSTRTGQRYLNLLRGKDHARKCPTCGARR